MAEQETTVGTEQAQPNGSAGAKAPTKWAAVTQILAERGTAFTPTQIRDEMKSRFGLEIGLNTASTYKRDILRKQAGAKGKGTATPKPEAKKATPARKEPASRKVAARPAPPRAPAAGGGTSG